MYTTGTGTGYYGYSPYVVTTDKILDLVDNIMDALELTCPKNDRDSVEQRDDSLYIEIPAMGYEKDEISITYVDNYLKVNFESKEKEKRKFNIKKEFCSYKYNVCKEKYDIEKLEATLLKGILTITIPKKEEVKPKKFTVK